MNWWIACALCVGSVLAGCGVTAWQRDQDRMAEAMDDLSSPQMEARIQEARR